MLWDKWEMLFCIACLLHDCAHAPFSHTLEYIYDIDLVDNNLGIEDGNKKIITKLQEIFPRISFKGKQHELASIYFISKVYSKDICEILTEEIKRKWENDYSSIKLSEHIPNNNHDDIEFIARMVTGTSYEIEKIIGVPYLSKTTKENLKIHYQFRNCIIGMLNSNMDVDSLDYLVRDTVLSGYENSQVDLERLFQSFSICLKIRCDKSTINISNCNHIFHLEEFKGTLHKAFIEDSRKIFTRTEERASQPSDYRQTVNNGLIFNGGVCINYNKENASLSYQRDEIGDIPNTVNLLDKKIQYNKFLSFYIQGRIEGTFTGDIYSSNIDEPKSFFHKDNDKDNYSVGIDFAYDKRSLSVLQSAIDARNYEYLWVYTHHKIAYSTNFLLNYLLYESIRRVLGLQNRIKSDRYFMNDDCTKMLSKVVSLFDKNTISNISYYQSCDDDIIQFFKRQREKCINSKKKNASDHEFLLTIEEFFERKYRPSLWKSYPEYKRQFLCWNDDEMDTIRRIFNMDNKYISTFHIPARDNQFMFSILRDYNYNKKDRCMHTELIEIFSDYGMESIVYIENTPKVKALDPDTMILIGQSCARLKDVEISRTETINFTFFYIFYRLKKDKNALSNNDRLELMEKLREFAKRNIVQSVLA